MKINFSQGFSTEKKSKLQSSDKIIVSDSVQPITVNGRQEYKITFDLKKYYKIEKNNYYSVSFKAKDQALSNKVHVYLSDETPSRSIGNSSYKTRTVNIPSRHVQATILLPIIGMYISGAVVYYRRRKTIVSR